MVASKIQPVILSGGTGSRLWPLSRAHYPKQVLALVSDATMLQETARRVENRRRFEAPLVVCNHEHRFIIAEQLREIGIEPNAIVLEPEGRNTAPAATIAALMAIETAPDCILFIMPSDHVIDDFDSFLPALDRATEAARNGALVAFGLPPRFPETGYGYIQRGPALATADGVYQVSRFIEKPDLATAERLLAGGQCYWNSGMFLFGAERYLAELESHSPQVLSAARKALAEVTKDLEFLRLDSDAFAASPAISIDYAVMEKSRHGAVVPTDVSWSDVGSWASLWEIATKDQDQNVVQGDVVLREVRNSYIRSDAKLVAAIGLEDVIIIATEDVILVAAKGHAQDVGILVDDLKAKKRSEVSEHRTVYRPWGHYHTIQTGPGFQVKEITVKPGAKLSLQLHHHRAEHWIVVSGTAEVVRGDEAFTLSENQSTYIPLGTKHRLENRGQVPLILIEVQSGGYLGEDDIVRFDDQYGRVK